MSLIVDSRIVVLAAEKELKTFLQLAKVPTDLLVKTTPILLHDGWDVSLLKSTNSRLLRRELALTGVDIDVIDCIIDNREKALQNVPDLPLKKNSNNINRGPLTPHPTTPHPGSNPNPNFRPNSNNPNLRPPFKPGSTPNPNGHPNFRPGLNSIPNFRGNPNPNPNLRPPLNPNTNFRPGSNSNPNADLRRNLRPTTNPNPNLPPPNQNPNQSNLRPTGQNPNPLQNKPQQNPNPLQNKNQQNQNPSTTAHPTPTPTSNPNPTPTPTPPSNPNPNSNPNSVLSEIRRPTRAAPAPPVATASELNKQRIIALRAAGGQLNEAPNPLQSAPVNQTSSLIIHSLASSSSPRLPSPGTGSAIVRRPVSAAVVRPSPLPPLDRNTSLKKEELELEIEKLKYELELKKLERLERKRSQKEQFLRRTKSAGTVRRSSSKSSNGGKARDRKVARRNEKENERRARKLKEKKDRKKKKKKDKEKKPSSTPSKSSSTSSSKKMSSSSGSGSGSGSIDKEEEKRKIVKSTPNLKSMLNDTQSSDSELDEETRIQIMEEEEKQKQKQNEKLRKIRKKRKKKREWRKSQNEWVEISETESEEGEDDGEFIEDEGEEDNSTDEEEEEEDDDDDEEEEEDDSSSSEDESSSGEGSDKDDETEEELRDSDLSLSSSGGRKLGKGEVQIPLDGKYKGTQRVVPQVSNVECNGIVVDMHFTKGGLITGMLTKRNGLIWNTTGSWNPKTRELSFEVKDSLEQRASYKHKGSYTVLAEDKCVISGNYVRSDLTLENSMKGREGQYNSPGLQRILTFGTFSYEYMADQKPS